MSNKKYPLKVLVAYLGLIGLSSAVVARAEDLYRVAEGSDLVLSSEAIEGSTFFTDSLSYLKFGVTTGVEYDGNLFLERTGAESDIIVSTGITLGLENGQGTQNYWSLAYNAAHKAYVDNSSLNAIDSSFRGSYGKSLSKTEIYLNGSIDDTSGSDRFANGRVDRLRTTLDLDVTRIISDKTRLDYDLGYSGENYENDSINADRYVYDTRLTWQYQWTGKTSVGPYAGYEYVSVERGPDARAWSTGVTTNYQAFAKTTFSGSIGVENRSFSGSSSEDRTSGIFNLGVTHNYSPKITMAASLYRNTQSSVSTFGNSFETTGLGFNVNYSVNSRFTLLASANYSYDDYYATATTTATAPNTDYYTFDLGSRYSAPHGVVYGVSATWQTQSADDNLDEFDRFSLRLNASYNF